MQKHALCIGTSGWSYKHWRGTFYPKGTKISDEFAYYRRHFNTVEINNTFYRLPERKTFLDWKKQVDDDFVYIIKASRYITHMKKLREPEESTTLFLERAAALGEKLGAILFQLPPNMKANLPRLEAFLGFLPKTFRYVFEFRNPDWYREETYKLLKKYNCAFCIYELAGHQSPIEITANFTYLRLHGPGGKYQGSYPDATLKKWAKQCKEWLESLDVYVYFDNDEKGYAAFNAMKLASLVKP
jgi:uncharacterized protein YecE (DUF72 family)